MTHSKILQTGVILITLNLGCQQATNQNETTALGTIDFKVTSSPEAKESFEKGVLLLHSFMYSDAAGEFRKAQLVDPDFAMAYWGEAMTYNHPLWSEQNYEKATETLNRLGTTSEERLSKAPTDFEKDLFQAVEILYGEESKIERDDLYTDHLARLHEKYPGNHEISAFFALSLLGSVESGRDYTVYEKGAKIAEGILNENPSHPGALHYLIHSYDDPDHASLALEAANNYSEVAPDAGHALHMPSHIYIALGMWDNVISSNIRSYDARLKRIEENSELGWNLHAYSWLLYGYLQKNDMANVDKIMNRMEEYAKTKGGSNYSKSYLIDMVGNFLAETGNWNDDAPSMNFDTEGLNVRFEVSKLFIDGYKEYTNKNELALTEILDLMDVKIADAKNKLITRGITVCSGGCFASRPPNQDDIDMAGVMALQLEIGLAQLKDAPDADVEELMMKATDLESSISFSFGPPAIVIPTYEMYGKWLVERERYDDALVQFDKSLEKGPGRRNALLGKLEAAKGLGDQSIVEEIQRLIPNNSS